LFGPRFACAQTAIFFAKPYSINAGEISIVFGLRLEGKEFHHSAIQTKIEELFGGFFHQIKVCQTIEGQDSMQTVIRTSTRLDSFLRLRTLKSFQIFKIKNKKLRTYSG
jgi:hypothetical protein